MKMDRCTQVMLSQAELELYQYPQTKQRLRDAERDVIFQSAGSATEVTSRKPGCEIDPTAQRAIRLAGSREVEWARRVVRAVENVYRSLPDGKKTLTWLVFWERMTLSGAAREMDIDRETARRWRADVCRQVAMSLEGDAVRPSNSDTLSQQA